MIYYWVISYKANPLTVAEYYLVDDNTCFLFSRLEHHLEGYHTTLFSVVSRSAHPTIKNRVVVEHVGDETGLGTWKCYKDANTMDCAHIAEAKSSLQDYTGHQVNVDLEGEGLLHKMQIC
jgi:hypothetical protein